MKKIVDKNSCTLRERILMELAYFEETGKHLDVDNITLCAGSRNRYGGMPTVYWCDWFNVGWYYPSYRDSYLRSRSVVSNPSTLNLEVSESLIPTPLGEAIEVVKKAGYKVIKEL